MVTRSEAEELLRTLFADPVAARARAEEELVPDPDPAVSSIGHQIIGIVLRDIGETDQALAHLRRAMRLARAVDGDRAADVRATLGASLVHAGRTREGLAHLDRSADELDGLPLARVLVRRAKVLSFNLERFEAGADDLRRAHRLLDRSGDEVWRARALNIEGVTRTGLGDLTAARRAFAESLEIYTALGIHWDVAVGVHNQGWVAFLEGDLPRALERYADASDRFDALGVTSVELVYDQCNAYLAGRLATDALDVVDRALVARPLAEVERADLLLALAGAALAAHDLDRARSAADEACRLFRRQGRRQHWIRAELLAIWARAESTDPPARLLGRTEVLVEAAHTTGAPELPQALLLGARLAGRVRSRRASDLSERWLDEAAGLRGATTGTSRALGWLAMARRRELAGDVGGVLRACDRGLAAIDEHQATLGSQELRAPVDGPRCRTGRARDPNGAGVRRRPTAPALVGAVAGHIARPPADHDPGPRPGDGIRPGRAPAPAQAAGRRPGRR